MLPSHFRRVVCRLVGHRWSPKGYTSTGSFTGYCEHTFCERCGHEEIVQVPQ